MLKTKLKLTDTRIQGILTVYCLYIYILVIPLLAVMHEEEGCKSER